MTGQERGPDAAPLVLAVDPDHTSRQALVVDLTAALDGRAHIVAAENAEQALALLAEAPEQVALLAVAVATDAGRGVQLLERARELTPDARRLALGNPAPALRRALSTGAAHDVVARPWAPADAVLTPVVIELFDDWRAGRPGLTITVVGDRGAASHRLRDIFTRNPVPHRYLDAGDHGDGDTLLAEHGSGELPLVVVDGTALWNPPEPQLWQALGERTTPLRRSYDLVIAGAGPAGLAAAVNGASEGLSTLVVEREAPGGQAGSSSRIENYVGFPTGISGAEIGRRAYSQAVRLGAESIGPRRVTAISPDGDGGHRVRIEGGYEVTARAVVIATGADWARLEIPGAERFAGSGLYYGAAMAEARAVRDRPVVVVGGANSAGQAAVFFARLASTVTVAVRAAALDARMSRYLVDQIDALPNVTVRTRTRLVAVDGDHQLTTARLHDLDTDRHDEVAAAAVFVFIGARPASDWLAGTVARDEYGFVRTGTDLAGDEQRPPWPLRRDPLPHETSLPGVFAVGDVRRGATKRVSSAVGEGSVVVPAVHRYLQLEPEPR